MEMHSSWCHRWIIIKLPIYVIWPACLAKHTSAWPYPHTAKITKFHTHWPKQETETSTWPYQILCMRGFLKPNRLGKSENGQACHWHALYINTFHDKFTFFQTKHCNIQSQAQGLEMQMFSGYLPLQYRVNLRLNVVADYKNSETMNKLWTGDRAVEGYRLPSNRAVEGYGLLASCRVWQPYTRTKENK